MIYLACPYWHFDKEIRNVRHQVANKAAAYLLYTLQEPIFSPLTHNVPLSNLLLKRYGLKSGHGETLGHEFWVKVVDLPILRKCNKLIVVTMAGWDESKGVEEELFAAQTVQIPIQYLEPTFEENTYEILEWRLYG
jgi:hypothetical protein